MNETGGSYGTQPWPSDWWHVTGANWAFSTGWSASLWLESHFNMFDLWRLSAQIIDQFPWKKCGDRDDRDEGGFSRMFGGKFKDLGQFLISRSFRWRSQAVISVPGKTRWGKNMSIEEKTCPLRKKHVHWGNQEPSRETPAEYGGTPRAKYGAGHIYGGVNVWHPTMQRRGTICSAWQSRQLCATKDTGNRHTVRVQQCPAQYLMQKPGKDGTFSFFFTICRNTLWKVSGAQVCTSMHKYAHLQWTAITWQWSVAAEEPWRATAAVRCGGRSCKLWSSSRKHDTRCP